MPKRQMTRDQLRNLRQNKDKTDEEFEEWWDTYQAGILIPQEFENRIQRKIEEFSKDYDLDDLKANDMMTLRALAQAFIKLEDLEALDFKFRTNLENVGTAKLVEMERINSMLSVIRKDISNLQTDLDITRKHRKGDKELTIVSELERLKSKAKEFYQERMFYVLCPKCKMLLSTVWFLYPEEKGNKIQLVCNRVTDNGEICGEKIQISSKELLERRGINIEEVPEFFK